MMPWPLHMLQLLCIADQLCYKIYQGQLGGKFLGYKILGHHPASVATEHLKHLLQDIDGVQSRGFGAANQEQYTISCNSQQ